MNSKITKFYWMQLLALAGVHFLIDMFASMLPTILPAIRDEFGLSLSRGGLVLAALLMTSNGVQPLIGHMRANRRRPLFLHLGLILGASICLLGALPRGENAFAIMILLAVVSGCGIAIVHPEGLRAVYWLRSIPPAISTAVFMAGGFLGYASGGAISALLVSRFGLKGLYPLALCPVIGIILVIFLRIRLAVERKVRKKKEAQTEENQLPFWLIMAMAMPAAISTIVLITLLPTVLNEFGFELTFGGFSTMMFGLGGAVGSFVWANLARKKGELNCSIAALFLVVPFLVVYLALIDNKMAIWILFGVGFCAISAYILMITLSRYATGLSLGQRMGFMAGGTWALASIVFIALLPAVEHFGPNVILKFTPLGYLCSGAFGFYVMLKVQTSTRAKLSVQ
ncbi:MAG: MFS transporter [Planctomycetes bacterium]|nr:MFS transporter [Planctomycetota bacterium]